MALQSRMRPKVLWFSVGYAVLCAGLGVWGAYDYWERIPRQEAQFLEYTEAQRTSKRYTDMMAAGAVRLTPEQDAEYQRAAAVVDRYASGAPTPVAAYDRPLQLWVYMIGCGILGTGWCIAGLARTASRSFRLDDDGTLHVGSRSVVPDDVTGIDMTRWMAKSIATLQVRDGVNVVLDDYKYSGLHLIVGAYAHRFHPQAWNADATPVKKGTTAASGAGETASTGIGAGGSSAPSQSHGNPGAADQARDRQTSA